MCTIRIIIVSEFKLKFFRSKTTREIILELCIIFYFIDNFIQLFLLETKQKLSRTFSVHTDLPSNSPGKLCNKTSYKDNLFILHGSTMLFNRNMFAFTTLCCYLSAYISCKYNMH